jgi:hypothetical protein
MVRPAVRRKITVAEGVTENAWPETSPVSWRSKPLLTTLGFGARFTTCIVWRPPKRILSGGSGRRAGFSLQRRRIALSSMEPRLSLAPPMSGTLSRLWSSSSTLGSRSGGVARKLTAGSEGGSGRTLCALYVALAERLWITFRCDARSRAPSGPGWSRGCICRIFARQILLSWKSGGRRRLLASPPMTARRPTL